MIAARTFVSENGPDSSPPVDNRTNEPVTSEPVATTGPLAPNSADSDPISDDSTTPNQSDTPVESTPVQSAPTIESVLANMPEGQATQVMEQYNALSTEEEKTNFLNGLAAMQAVQAAQEAGPVEQPAQQLTLEQEELLRLTADVGPEKAKEMMLLTKMEAALKEANNRAVDEVTTAQHNPALRILRDIFNVPDNRTLMQTLGDAGLNLGIFTGATIFDIATGRALIAKLEPLLTNLPGRLRLDVSLGADGRPNNPLHMRIVKFVLDRATDMIMRVAVDLGSRAIHLNEAKRKLSELGFSEEDIALFVENYKNGAFVTPVAAGVAAFGGAVEAKIPGTQLAVQEVVSPVGLQALANLLDKTPFFRRIKAVLDRINVYFKGHPVIGEITNAGATIAGMLVPA
ncbi:hypothetical protein JW962_02680 [Candidatus Dojkabacteria bacterium]|nr:hypothetical protein [Candidatus Dojkabacteria bacterium]